MINKSSFNNNFIQTNFKDQNSHESLNQIILNQLMSLEEPHQERLKEEFFNYGPLKALLNNDSITEIIINRFNSIWIEIDGRLQCHFDTFFSQQTYDSFLQRLYLELGQEPTLTHPFVDGSWHEHRIHIIGYYSPMMKDVRITIRKHKIKSWTLNDLFQLHWASTDQEISFLSQLVRDKQNILIIGPAGSGKTSVLKALLNECNAEERIIIIEDSKEIVPPSDSGSHLLTRNDARGVLPNIDLSDLIKQSLRMRPDRLVIGEVRGNESKDLLLALATGHHGSFGTLHASDPWQALIRLEMLIQMGASHWSLESIRKLILLSLNYIIVCSRDRNGKRKLANIYKLISVEASGIIIERLNF